MNKVTTTSTCERCPATVVREGAHDIVPGGWAVLTLVQREPGQFVGMMMANKTLCPACQDAVLAVLKPAKPCPCNNSGRLPCLYCGLALNPPCYKIGPHKCCDHCSHSACDCQVGAPDAD